SRKARANNAPNAKVTTSRVKQRNSTVKRADGKLNNIVLSRGKPIKSVTQRGAASNSLRTQPRLVKGNSGGKFLKSRPTPTPAIFGEAISVRCDNTILIGLQGLPRSSLK